MVKKGKGAVNRKRKVGQTRNEYRAKQYAAAKLAKELASILARELNNANNENQPPELPDETQEHEQSYDCVLANTPAVEPPKPQPECKTFVPKETVQSGLRDCIRTYGINQRQSQGLLDFFC